VPGRQLGVSDEVEIRQFRDRFGGREGGPKWRAAVADKIIEAVQSGTGNIEALVESGLFYVEGVAFDSARREITQK
jgi:hypothetical protein